MSLPDDEGSHADILIDGVPWQIKSLCHTAAGQVGMLCDLHTMRWCPWRNRNVKDPYHEHSFHTLIGIYRRGSVAFIYIIPMAKLREKRKVSILDAAGTVLRKGVATLIVHLSAEDFGGWNDAVLPGEPICESLRWVPGGRGQPPKNKWTEECFDVRSEGGGFVDMEGMMSA